MSVTQFAMVEELAFLIRDNLRSKHLVLAMEDTFVNFLHHDTSSDGILELEPMDPYNRLLLHRLADIFGFAHVSIGEGEDRHLILERCPETSIPAILISDILTQYDEPLSISIPHQVLRRDGRDDATPVLQAKVPTLSSIKEREAAYLAARQRIFSVDVTEMREPSEQRPRNVPAAARRMIAHALGQKATPPGKDVPEEQSDTESRDFHGRNKEEGRPKSLEDSQESSSSRHKQVNSFPTLTNKKQEHSTASPGQENGGRGRLNNELSKEEHSRAARRIFANALGLQQKKGNSVTR